MLAELLDAAEAERFPPLIDSLDVAPGYEKALAAALGDDLDASLDGGAPVHWGAAPSARRRPRASRRRRARSPTSCADRKA